MEYAGGGKYEAWDALLANKTKRLLFPYFSFGIVVLAPCMLITKLTDSYLNYCQDILFGKDVRHLWYLLSLYEMFVIAYFLRSLLEKQRWIVSLIQALVIAITCKYTTDFDILQLKMTVSYMPFFIFGYYVGNGSAKIDFSDTKAFLFLLLGFIGWGLKYRLGDFLVPILDYVVAFLFILAIFHFSNYAYSSGGFYHILLKNGMGIYLWHVIILYVAYYYDLFTSMGVYVQVCLMSGISLFLSILLTLLTRRLHLTSLLGESK